MTTSETMTPTQARVKIGEFCNRAGGEMEVLVSLSQARYARVESLSASAYPRGIGRGSALTVYADTFEVLLEKLEEKWEELIEENTQRTVTAIALKIIELTYDQGECTDAALRTEGFTTDDIVRHAAEAAYTAGKMSEGAPFGVRFIAGDNGAPAEDEAENNNNA